MMPVLSPVSPLLPSEADGAVWLWKEAGLTRPWNDPHADIAAALACSSSTVLAAREQPMPGDASSGTGDAARIVATVMVGYDGHRGWLYYLAVAEDRRGRGLGRAMVRAAEIWLREHGAPAVQLLLRDDNAAAGGFYAALGYERRAVSVFGKRFG